MSPKKRSTQLSPYPVSPAHLQALKGELTALGNRLDPLHEQEMQELDTLEVSPAREDKVGDLPRMPDDTISYEFLIFELERDDHARYMNLRKEAHAQRMAAELAAIEREAYSRRQHGEQRNKRVLRPAEPRNRPDLGGPQRRFVAPNIRQAAEVRAVFTRSNDLNKATEVRGEKAPTCRGWFWRKSC